MNISTKVVLIVTVLLGVFFTFMVVSAVKTHIEYQDKGKDMGCEYLGSPRDLGSVRFFDCNGEIKMERTQ